MNGIEKLGWLVFLPLVLISACVFKFCQGEHDKAIMLLIVSIFIWTDFLLLVFVESKE